MSQDTDQEVLDAPEHPQALAKRNATTEIASSRAAQEVQAAMVVAKRFPRDATKAFNSIMQACKRKGLAEAALYAYPRGGTTVTGPSIRMAEVLAQCWGNMDFGIIELEQRKGESSVMAYAWDLETNTRQSKVFQVRHERAVGKGQNQRLVPLSDPRDIYEMCANQGARRLRACILGVIPGDVVDAAIDECDRTMKGNNKEPLADRARKMIVAFAEFSVTQAMIEQRLGHKVEAINETEMVSLRKIYTSIKDSMTAREAWFQVGDAPATSDSAKPRAQAIAEKLKGSQAHTPDTAAELERQKAKLAESEKAQQSDPSVTGDAPPADWKPTPIDGTPPEGSIPFGNPEEPEPAPE
jgi:hypothetical protein